MENQNTENIDNNATYSFLKLKALAAKIGKILIVAIALFIGFMAGQVYTNYKVSRSSSQRVVPQVRTITETSVALNERNEMLIINRVDGTYEIYQDSVGLTIFNLYAGKMYYEKNNPNQTPATK